MEDAYFDPRHPGSFGGVNSLYRHLDKKYKLKDVKHWLSQQDAYTLHRPVRWRFRRRKVFSAGINALWQADLADLSSIAKYNDGNRYLLTCIDVFSKRAWAAAIKKKSSDQLTAAFLGFIKDRKPTHLQTDKGTEFLNRKFQKMLKDRNIAFYTTENEDIKASVVERFNRTLKTKMWKYFSFKNTLRYVDVLEDLIQSYNETFHRSIQMAPSEVDARTEAIVRGRLYGPEKIGTALKYAVGDKVRISKARRIFKKGYLPGWTEEIFVVSARLRTDPPTYELNDSDGEPVKGKFYEEELQKIVKYDDVYRVEKVLRTRRRAGKKEYFVKWKGYPNKFNSWVANIIK